MKRKGDVSKCKICNKDFIMTRSDKVLCGEKCNNAFKQQNAKSKRLKNHVNPINLEGEEWRFIEDTNNRYSVSNLGRIKSHFHEVEKLVNPVIHPEGYYRFGIKFNGKIKAQLVHRVVAKAFKSQVPGANVVNHIDGNKLNNYVENLEYVSHRDNCLHYLKSLGMKCKYVGVNETKGGGKFVARINIDKKPIYLGTFDSAQKAHLAYKEALIKYKIQTKYSV